MLIFTHIQDKIESKMLEAYNCIPPWLPTHLRSVNIYNSSGIRFVNPEIYN